MSALRPVKMRETMNNKEEIANTVSTLALRVAAFFLGRVLLYLLRLVFSDSAIRKRTAAVFF